MKSALPKVLHRLGGRALLHHVLDCAAQLSARRAVIVTGHGAMEVEAACARFQGATDQFDMDFARQEPQLGTGHAVQQAIGRLGDDGVTLVLSGDVPLTQSGTLQALSAQCDGQRLALLTLSMPDPTGYGRIERSGLEPSAQVRAIVEHKDANTKERAINEGNTGILAAPAKLLRQWLATLVLASQRCWPAWAPVGQNPLLTGLAQ